MNIPKAGSKAPNFKSTDQNGKAVGLSDFAGKKLVIYFYPKDDTPGCTAEACSLRDNYKALQAAGYEILGVSSDNAKSHTKFIGKYDLPFRLLADTDLSVHKAFGTWVEKSMYGRKYMGTARVTFVIDEKGVISEVIEKVDTKEHAAQILKPEGTGTAKASAKKTAAPKKAEVKKTAVPAKKAAVKKAAAPAKKTAVKKAVAPAKKAAASPKAEVKKAAAPAQKTAVKKAVAPAKKAAVKKAATKKKPGK